ncbi:MULTISPECIES: hypothetical protein [unclassified Streptomyces]|nr:MULTISPECIES: hypothetical protein [unclassified Streptomyces]WUC68290.1 hypothetical protein OG861_30820 [Streptomyces sp. NBC_00539]
MGHLADVHRLVPPQAGPRYDEEKLDDGVPGGDGPQPHQVA